jgi:surface polysaccharide O-acyltransferase-like enzyme
LTIARLEEEALHDIAAELHFARAAARSGREILLMKTNYAAVFVSALAYWLLGAVWYGALFSKPWMALENISMEQAKSMNPVLPYVITFVLNLLIAYSLAQICIWRNANTIGRGASVGVLLWIGFVGPITFTTYMYEMRPKELYAINQFYPLAGMVLMGAIIGAWTKKTA